MGWIPTMELIANPTAVPAMIATQENAIYLTDFLSDRIIDGIDAAINDISTEKPHQAFRKWKPNRKMDLETLLSG
jgi:hypothetical protein